MRLANNVIKGHSGFPMGLGNIDDNAAWVKETLKDVLENFDFAFEGFRPELDEIEHRSRDGFIPYSHNRGGFDVKSFSDLYEYFGTGQVPCDAMQKAIDQGLKDALEAFVENNPEVLFQGIAPEELSYHSLYDAGLGQYAEILSETEREFLSGDYSSVMSQVRVMYHGVNAGMHSLTVFASLSWTDAPYHRSSDVLEERLITFKTQKELETKLKAALEDVNSIF